MHASGARDFGFEEFGLVVRGVGQGSHPGCRAERGSVSEAFDPWGHLQFCVGPLRFGNQQMRERNFVEMR